MLCGRHCRRRSECCRRMRRSWLCSNCVGQGPWLRRDDDGGAAASLPRFPPLFPPSILLLRLLRRATSLSSRPLPAGLVPLPLLAFATTAFPAAAGHRPAAARWHWFWWPSSGVRYELLEPSSHAPRAATPHHLAHWCDIIHLPSPSFCAAEHSRRPPHANAAPPLLSSTTRTDRPSTTPSSFLPPPFPQSAAPADPADGRLAAPT